MRTAVISSSTLSTARNDSWINFDSNTYYFSFDRRSKGLGGAGARYISCVDVSALVAAVQQLEKHAVLIIQCKDRSSKSLAFLIQKTEEMRNDILVKLVE